MPEQSPEIPNINRKNSIISELGFSAYGGSVVGYFATREFVFRKLGDLDTALGKHLEKIQEKVAILEAAQTED